MKCSIKNIFGTITKFLTERDPKKHALEKKNVCALVTNRIKMEFIFSRNKSFIILVLTYLIS